MLCPANILGYLFAIRLALTGGPDVECSKVPHLSPKAGLLNAPSFRAECPALLVFREAPGTR